MRKILKRIFKFIENQKIESKKIVNITLLNRKYEYLEEKVLCTQEKTNLNNLIIKFNELINDIKNTDVNEHHRERLIELCKINKEIITIKLKNN